MFHIRHSACPLPPFAPRVTVFTGTQTANVPLLINYQAESKHSFCETCYRFHFMNIDEVYGD